MTRTKKRNAFIAAGGATLFSVCAALGLGLHHSPTPKAPNTEAQETARLLQDSTISQPYAACLARVLVSYGAQGDEWDKLAASDRAIVQIMTERECPRRQFN